MDKFFDKVESHNMTVPRQLDSDEYVVGCTFMIIWLSISSLTTALLIIFWYFCLRLLDHFNDANLYRLKHRLDLCWSWVMCGCDCESLPTSEDTTPLKPTASPTLIAQSNVTTAMQQSPSSIETAISDTSTTTSVTVRIEIENNTDDMVKTEEAFGNDNPITQPTELNVQSLETDTCSVVFQLPDSDND